MVGTYTHTFNTAIYKGEITINTGLFINGQFVDPVENGTIDVVNPANGKAITAVSVASARDVDIAVAAAKQAYKTSWGFKVPGPQRGRMLAKLADLMEARAEEFAALEALDVGKTYLTARHVDVKSAIDCVRYYAGWADKIHGKSVEGGGTMLGYTRHEPIGVVGQIIPWNFPLCMLAWKIAPALATGNTIVIKPSETTPLTALFIAPLINEAGFPPGVVNIVNGLGPVVGHAISSHPLIGKVAFTGSTRVGRLIMRDAAESNLKPVSLELGGKSPNIIFDDADLGQAVKWAAHGIFFNMGQTCTAGSRIYVQEGIYDKFLEQFSAAAKALKIGEPFDPTTTHGPQISRVQFDRVMGYIDSGLKDGAQVHIGGQQHGSEGYFVQPTIFTHTRPDMRIVKEEIFGPVAVVVKFRDEEDVIQQANDSLYGLAAAVFTENIGRAVRVANAIEAGTVGVNCVNSLDLSLPFGGYKQSGIGRELGEFAIQNYTAIKAVHINTGVRM